MRRMHTNWAKVKPEKQLANMPTAMKEILVATAGKEILGQGKKYQMDYRNRNLGTKVHQVALDKVMHGSVNKYFDVTPVGRVVQKFNNELGVFRGGLLSSFQSVFNAVSKACFQFGFLLTVSNWSFALLAFVIIYALRLGFFWRRALKKLNRTLRGQNAPGFSFIQESLLGKHVIKAFGKEKIFQTTQVEIYNRELVMWLARTSCHHWYQCRFFMITTLIKAFGMTLCIYYKGSLGTDSVTLLLVMQYTADMGWIKGVISNWMTLNN